MRDIGIIGSWLTVNRTCNMRCRWCYAEGTKYNKDDDMSLELACQLIDLEASLGIKTIVFIGGEPLLWKDLFKINGLAKEKGMSTVLVTNGALLSSERIMEQIKASAFDSINISLKAPNKHGYISLTESNTFNQVINGMRDLSKERINFEASITLNSLVANDLYDMVKVATDAGAASVTIHFCASTLVNGEPNRGTMMNPEEIVRCVVDNYTAIDQYTHGKFAIQQSLPMCIWPPDFIKLLKEKGQIHFGCHLMSRNGLVFDSKGSVIPCNCLHGCELGQYGTDFSDTESFGSFWKKEEVANFYDQIIAYPAKQCIGCEEYSACGGGCPLQWFVFKPENIIPIRKRGGG